MKRAYLMGEDLHLITAEAVLGKPQSEIGKEERKKAKPVNFGFLFGMYPKKFQKYAKINYGIDFSMAECELYRERFFQLYPGLVRWHNRQKRMVAEYQQVTSPLGRVRHLPDIMSPDNSVRMEAERQAINSPVQSCASDICLFAMVKIAPLLNPREATMVMTLHDGIGFEVKEERADYYAALVKETMETLPLEKTFGTKLSVPIVADVEYGTHWTGTEDASGLGFVGY